MATYMRTSSGTLIPDHRLEGWQPRSLSCAKIWSRKTRYMDTMTWALKTLRDSGVFIPVSTHASQGTKLTVSRNLQRVSKMTQDRYVKTYMRKAFSRRTSTWSAWIPTKTNVRSSLTKSKSALTTRTWSASIGSSSSGPSLSATVARLFSRQPSRTRLSWP